MLQRERAETAVLKLHFDFTRTILVFEKTVQCSTSERYAKQVEFFSGALPA